MKNLVYKMADFCKKIPAVVPYSSEILLLFSWVFKLLILTCSLTSSILEMAKIYKCLLCLLAMLVSYQVPARQHLDNTKSLLWRISGNGLAKPSYLFGTIHLICKSDYFWTNEMKECFANSDVVCMEMDFGDSAIMRAAVAGTKDPDGIKLKSYFTPEEYIVVRNYFLNNAKTDLDDRQDSKLSMLIGLNFRISLGCQKVASYELNLAAVAKKIGKKTSGLETLQEQLDALATIPADKLVKGMVAIANDNTRCKELVQKMVAAYKDQDQALTYKIVSQPSFAINTDVLINERNKKWIPRMTTKMEQGSVFFAVGAGHLGGEQGLINLLKEAGYTVEPVLSPPADVKPDKMPKPSFDLNKYLSENMHYPEKARRKNIEGNVIVEFTVAEDGSVSDPKIVKGIGGGCNEEAIRIIENMPHWEPGLKNGKPIQVRYKQPIQFKLQ